MKNIWNLIGVVSLIAALTLICSVVFAVDLVIKDVPDVKSVQDEILRNAEASVRNYLSSSIKTIETVKIEAYETAVSAFKTANKLDEVRLIGQVVETETVIDGGSK